MRFCHAHNLYLQVALDQGIFGLVAVIGLIFSAVVAAISVWRLADGAVRVPPTL